MGNTQPESINVPGNGGEASRRRRMRSLPPSSSSARNAQRCGKCGLARGICRCNPDMPMETVAELLQSCRGLSAGHLQHLHVFVYIPYRRWAASLPDEQFGAVCMPPYEGWYGCWVRPSGAPPRRVGGFDEPVLQVDLRFHDRSAQRAFITRGGHLVAVVPAISPRFGVPLDARTTSLQFETLDTARLLTLDEIVLGIRGAVRGSCAPKNNGRKVSHVVGDDGAGSFVLRRIPKSDYEEVEFAHIPYNVVREYAPEIVNEYVFRHRPSLTKPAATALLPYLEGFFLRATQCDLAAREANKPVAEFKGSSELSHIAKSHVVSLKKIVALMDAENGNAENEANIAVAERS